MANTRSSTKRARQSLKKQALNQMKRSKVRSALRAALDPLRSGKVDDLSQIRAAYVSAVRAVSKAASSGVIPKNRAARKISRLTHLAKKVNPQVLAKG